MWQRLGQAGFRRLAFLAGVLLTFSANQAWIISRCYHAAELCWMTDQGLVDHRVSLFELFNHLPPPPYLHDNHNPDDSE
jgi:hypothetical protein